MKRRPAGPRGLVSRALIAAVVFAGAIVPGWALGDLAERWTGWALLDWLVTCGWSGLAVFALGPYGSYRHRDVMLGILPLYGWYVADRPAALAGLGAAGRRTVAGPLAHRRPGRLLAGGRVAATHRFPYGHRAAGGLRPS
jgi:hypothetical protein